MEQEESNNDAELEDAELEPTPSALAGGPRRSRVKHARQAFVGVVAALHQLLGLQ